MNSRNKGKRGEREFAALLREHGFDARRGQQFAGGAIGSRACMYRPKPSGFTRRRSQCRMIKDE